MESLDLPVDGHNRLSYVLRGRAALKHARRVHAKIRGQLLRYKQVTAVDVGFAVHERRKAFLNLLSIRIHVNKKHSVDHLRRNHYPIFTSPGWRLGEVDYPSGYAYLAAKVGASVDEPTGATAMESAWPYPLSVVSPEDLSFVEEPPAPEPEAISSDDEGLDSNDGLRKYRDDPYEGHLENGRCKCCRRCGRCCRSISESGLCCHHTRKTKKQYCECCKKKDHHDYHCRHCRLAICGVPLDIIEANYFPSVRNAEDSESEQGVFVGDIESSDNLPNDESLRTGRGRVSPLVGGISIGNINGQAGTLSAIVWDKTDGSPCVLANWHVLAGSNTAERGQQCFQPALFDGGCHEDAIGNLKRWHLDELGDAALAELDGSRPFASGEILGMWHPIAGYRPPKLNLEVRKWGRTTGFTQGFIDGIDLATDITYGSDLVRHFEDQFHIAPLYRGEEVSQPGDSGALILTSYYLRHRHNLESLLDDLRVIVQELLKKADETGNAGDASKEKKGASREDHDSKKSDQDVRKKDEVEDQDGSWDFDSLKELAKAHPRDTVTLVELIRELVSPRPTLVEDEEGHSLPLTPHDADSVLSGALRACRDGSGDEKTLRDFKRLLTCVLDDYGLDLEEYLSKKKDHYYRRTRNAYYAVGMLFAGDTPGSPFGEFALASDIHRLADDLKFSLRPVFEPRTSFRKLRSEPTFRRRHDRRRRGPAREPGEPGSDPRGGGPQPDGEPYQSGGGGTGGGG